jgi:hypothetical protein
MFRVDIINEDQNDEGLFSLEQHSPNMTNFSLSYILISLISKNVGSYLYIFHCNKSSARIFFGLAHDFPRIWME